MSAATAGRRLRPLRQAHLARPGLAQRLAFACDAVALPAVCAPFSMAVAFLCDSPGAVDQLYTELVESGAEPRKQPWDAFWGQRYAQDKDPDGNVVDLFAPLEG